MQLFRAIIYELYSDIEHAQLGITHRTMDLNHRRTVLLLTKNDVFQDITLSGVLTMVIFYSHMVEMLNHLYDGYGLFQTLSL